MTTIELNVPDISCDHCKQSIESRLAATAGVRGSVVHVDTKTVEVDYDPSHTSPAEVAAAIEAIGYTVSDPS